MKQKTSTLVLGIGNILRKDDGVGVHVIKYMQNNNIVLPNDIELIDGGIAGFDLISYMMEYDRIIIVDALKVQDKPGSIFRFDAKYLNAQSPNVSLHELGIAEVLTVLKIQGKNPYVEIIGIVPENTDELDISLSQPVAESIPKVVDMILKSVSAQ
ncbi:MAG: HyaD/HybD family hydrogenase maturation endopeptidase [Spirochaetota bacterium]